MDASNTWYLFLTHNFHHAKFEPNASIGRTSKFNWNGVSSVVGISDVLFTNLHISFIYLSLFSQVVRGELIEGEVYE